MRTAATRQPGTTAGDDPDQQREAESAAEAARRFREIKKLVNQLIAIVYKADVVIDALSREIPVMEEFFESGRLPNSSSNRLVIRRQRNTQADEQLRQLAEAGAHSLEIKPRADGLAEVRIDGGKIFTLSPLLADVLRILAIDNGPSEDDLVGWKTLDEVAILLTKDSGKQFRKHAVTQNVYRLRKAMFAQGGANPFLVQTNRQRGVRFARRRRLAAAITCDRS